MEYKFVYIMKITSYDQSLELVCSNVCKHKLQTMIFNVSLNVGYH